LYIFSKSRQSDEGVAEATSRSFNAEFGKIYKAHRVGSEEAILHKIFHRRSFGYDSKKVLHNLTSSEPIEAASLFRNKSF
jgi:hypothetical protein